MVRAHKPVFYVFNTQASWLGQGSAAQGVEVTDDGLAFASAVCERMQKPEPLNSRLKGLRIGAVAVGECGILYLLDKKSHTLYAWDEVEESLSVVLDLQEWLHSPVALCCAGTSFYVADIDASASQFLKVSRTTGQVIWAVPLQALAHLGFYPALSTLRASLSPTDIWADKEHVLVYDRHQQWMLTFNTGDGSQFGLGEQRTTKQWDTLTERGGQERYVWDHVSCSLVHYTRTSMFSDGQGDVAQLQGTYLSPLQFAEPGGSPWHKMVIQAHIPPGTRARLSYALSVQEAELDYKIWSSPSDLQDGTASLLLSDNGYVLRFKIELYGTPALSPRVKTVRVYQREDSYLDYLPEIYSEDEFGREFLGRMLSLYQNFLTESELRIEQFPWYLVLDSAEGEWLRWLAAWLGCSRYHEWPDSRLRALLKRLPELYRYRGTPYTIATMIALCTEYVPEAIVESFRYQNVEDEEQRRTFQALYGTELNGYSVLFRPESILRLEQRTALETVLQQETPAHVRADLVSLERMVMLDGHTYLNVNSYIDVPQIRGLNQGAKIAYNTRLTDPEQASQLVCHARLNEDAILN